MLIKVTKTEIMTATEVSLFSHREYTSEKQATGSLSVMRCAKEFAAILTSDNEFYSKSGYDVVKIGEDVEFEYFLITCNYSNEHLSKEYRN